MNALQPPADVLALISRHGAVRDVRSTGALASVAGGGDVVFIVAAAAAPSKSRCGSVLPAAD
jgi:hypothetical protein